MYYYVGMVKLFHLSLFFSVFIFSLFIIVPSTADAQSCYGSFYCYLMQTQCYPAGGGTGACNPALQDCICGDQCSGVPGPANYCSGDNQAFCGGGGASYACSEFCGLASWSCGYNPGGGGGGGNPTSPPPPINHECTVDSQCGGTSRCCAGSPANYCSPACYSCGGVYICATPTPCPPYNSNYSTYCAGSSLREVYNNGNCGTNDNLVQNCANGCADGACIGLPPPNTPTVRPNTPTPAGTQCGAGFTACGTNCCNDATQICNVLTNTCSNRPVTSTPIPPATVPPGCPDGRPLCNGACCSGAEQCVGGAGSMSCQVITICRNLGESCDTTSNFCCGSNECTNGTCSIAPFRAGVFVDTNGNGQFDNADFENTPDLPPTQSVQLLMDKTPNQRQWVAGWNPIDSTYYSYFSVQNATIPVGYYTLRTYGSTNGLTPGGKYVHLLGQSKVTIQGRHVQADGITLAPPPSGAEVTVSGPSGSTSTLRNSSGNPWNFTQIPGGAYTITASSFANYAISLMCNQGDCGSLTPGTWYGGNLLSHTLPNNGDYIDLYFRYIFRKLPPTPCIVTGAGDVDGDGYVTSLDSTMILRYAVGFITLTPAQLLRADTTGDGSVTVADGAAINGYLAGTISTFPACVANPTCSSLTKNARSGSGGVSAAGNITAGASINLFANIINDDGDHTTSAWSSTCGTFPSTNWDYATYTAPSTPGASCTISYSLNGANQPGCSAAVTVVAPACTLPTTSLTARGDIYVDTAGNNCASGSTLYSDTAPNLTMQRNGVSVAGPVTYNTAGVSPRYTLTNAAFCNDGSPTKTVVMTNLPAAYVVKATRVNSGAWTPLLGYTHTLSASSGTTTVDWCLSTASSWFQTDSGDVRYSSLTNRVPAGEKASTNATNPGVFFSSDDIINSLTFGQGTVSDIGWKVSDEYQYNDDFRNGLGGMSYTFYKSQARKLQRPIAFLSVAGLAGLGSLSTGIYEYTGNAVINTTTIDAAPPGRHIILLVSGTATINGPITLPTGRGNLFVLAAKGDITINPTVGRTAAETASSLDGYYTSEGSIILPTGANCTAGTPDLRLNVSGALVANSLRPFTTGGSGKIQNNRTLCGQNATRPALFVSSRPEFLTQLSDFYKTTYKTYREVSP